MELALTASVLAIAIGIPMGVYTGIHRDTWFSRLFMALSLIGVSLPVFLVGILLILIFSVTLDWLPSFGRGDGGGGGRLVDDGLSHLVGAARVDPAVDHVGLVSDDAHLAPGARRDAGGVAHRLYPFRAARAG